MAARTRDHIHVSKPSSAKSEIPQTLPSQSEMDGDAVMRVPCLTVLYHPDLARVGQRAVLDELMRNQTVPAKRSSIGSPQPERRRIPCR